ncbi:MAG: N-acetylglutaminylglutamine synthetase [Lautropia sp.]
MASDATRLFQQGWIDDLRVQGKPPMPESARNFALDCGWGRLLFGQTFASAEAMLDALDAEGPERRDIAFYIRDPHVVLAHAPQDVFLDPSHTLRIDLARPLPSAPEHPGFSVRRLSSRADAEAVNRIYAARAMVQVPPEFFWQHRADPVLSYWVAEDEGDGQIIGTVTGIDHAAAFGDPLAGSSLWCLAVDPQARHPGVGEALVCRLIAHMQARGAATMDLSVLHDNVQALALYSKLGFVRQPLFAVKRRNPINEKLFAGPIEDYDALNPYARIIVDEARRRGIGVEVTDAAGGFFRLSYGGRSLLCRESLSELTSGVAMSICDDKAVTRRVVERAGLSVPAQLATPVDDDAIRDFVARHGSVVVKPARGEQGRGISVGLVDVVQVRAAIERARAHCEQVLLEACFDGEDLRLLVIDFRVVAAALRRPPRIVGDDEHSVRELIERQSRRRAAATGGESRIPIDAETERCLATAGVTLDSIPARGTEIQVRRTANLHTGGTIHDVTEIVHGRLVDAACRAARAISIPVVGIDFMVRAPTEPEYVFIEANERPGLANHEPQPTAERFVDLLFPLAMPESVRRLSARAPATADPTDGQDTAA